MEREYLVKIKDLGQRYVKAENPKSALKKVCPLFYFVEETEETKADNYYRNRPISARVQSTSSVNEHGEYKNWYFYVFSYSHKDMTNISYAFDKRFMPAPMNHLEIIRGIMPLIHQKIKEVYGFQYLDKNNMVLVPYVTTKEDALLYHKYLISCGEEVFQGIRSLEFRKLDKMYEFTDLYLSESTIAPIAQRLVNRFHVGVCENYLVGVVVNEDNLERIAMNHNLGINLDYTLSLWVNITIYYDLDKEICNVVLDKGYLWENLEYDDNPDDRFKIKQVQDILKKPDKITINLSNCYSLI